jgi:hypothetical protein
MQEYFGIAAFRSRQQVLRFEAALKREGLPVRVISTPREVALGCGLSVRFNMTNYDAVRAIYDANPSQSFIGFYRCYHRDMRLVCEPLMRRMQP